MEKHEGMTTAVWSYMTGTMVAVLAFFVAGIAIELPGLAA
jgi:hypothetical protein